MTEFSALPEGIPPLTQYYFYLTAGCNLACRHCWLAPVYQPEGGSTGGHLDFELFKLAIEEGLPLGLQRVKLTGGEPLLHPDFLRMVDFLREKQLGMGIETNGTLLTPVLVQFLKEKSTLEHISLSLDGANPETHDAFRGVKGSFNRTVESLRLLAEAGLRPQVIMSLHAGNVDEIEPLVKMVGKLGATSVKFNLVQPSGRGETMLQRGQVLDIQRLVELGQWVEHDLQKSSQVQLFYSWPMAFFSLKRLLTRNSGSCGIYNILGVLATGQLAMCGIGMEIPELTYGRLGEDRVRDVWSTNPTLSSLRRSLPNDLEGVCRQCIFKQQCLGSCVAENYHQSGRITAPFWFCQQAEQIGLFQSARRTK